MVLQWLNQTSGGCNLLHCLKTTASKINSVSRLLQAPLHVDSVCVLILQPYAGQSSLNPPPRLFSSTAASTTMYNTVQSMTVSFTSLHIWNCTGLCHHLYAPRCSSCFRLVIGTVSLAVTPLSCQFVSIAVYILPLKWWLRSDFLIPTLFFTSA